MSSLKYLSPVPNKSWRNILLQRYLKTHDLRIDKVLSPCLEENVGGAF